MAHRVTERNTPMMFHHWQRTVSSGKFASFATEENNGAHRDVVDDSVKRFMIA
jgi:hypothetical protein